MTLPEAILAVFNDSLERCTRREDFLRRFYEILLANEEAARFFADTDMRQQRRKLRGSLYAMLPFIRGERASIEDLAHVKHRHGPSGLDIQLHLYDAWLEALVAAVAETDPLYDETVEAAWRRVMGEAIALLTQHD